jgi:putative protease
MHSPAIPELLAPAGSPDALIAAVSAGADAVYLGGTHYGARKNAANFGTSELEWALRYCHTRGVRVYVTLNTLLSDAEMQDAVMYACWLYERGVDAVIVQDVGLLDILHRYIPELSLHASTQMTILSADGLEWVHTLGCSRVILPRELTLDEISEMYHGSVDHYPEPEVFVHGALCYAYSGQCLLSSLIGGRSGNRGSCAQPCRREYTLLSGDTNEWGLPVQKSLSTMKARYLLSPRDLCTYPKIAEIIDSPVVSLKIEGRMKSPEYVAAVVYVYRKALDDAATGSFTPSEADQLTLQAAFNREFTAGYLLDGKSGTVMGPEAPGNRGVHIGSVSSYTAQKMMAEISLDTPYTPEAGDGLSFSDGTPGFFGGTVLSHAPVMRNRKFQMRVPMSVQAGNQVFLTKSGRASEYAAGLLRKNASRMVPVDLVLSFDDTTPILTGTSLSRFGEVSVSLKAGFSFSPAKTRPVSPINLEDLLTRTGDTPYYVRSFSSAYSGDLFAPIHEITEFRREFFSALEETGVRSCMPYQTAVDAVRTALSCESAILKPRTSRMPSVVPVEPEIAVYASDTDTVRGALLAGCRRIYFEPQGRHEVSGVCDYSQEWVEWTRSQIAQAASLCNEAGVDLIWKWPHITRQRFLDAACSIIPSLADLGAKGVMAENISARAAVRRVSPDTPLYGGMGFSIFNHHSARVLGDGCVSVTLSPELSFDSIAALVSGLTSKGGKYPIPECIIHGSTELAVSEDCIIATAHGRCLQCRSRPGTGRWYGIRDVKQHIFPVTIDDECRTHIWNSRETCLIDHLDRVMDAGIRRVALDCRIRNGRYAESVVRAYKKAFALLFSGTSMKGREIQHLKEQVQQIASGGITTGHFLQGVTDKEENTINV